jgi:flavin reductase (DIM6/NTAB) family NADH-FMN oxidoreductase RutF
VLAAEVQFAGVKQLFRAIHRGLKWIALGDADLPQQINVGMRDPQSEVEVMLHGSGPPRDVTSSFLMAAPAPFTVAVALDEELPGTANRLFIELRQRNAARRPLGRIRLGRHSVVPLGTRALYLFEVRGSTNLCLPGIRLWAHHLDLTAALWRDRLNPDIPLTGPGARAIVIFFMCPRPVRLLSVSHGEGDNFFPVNLMSPVGDGCFALSLNSSRVITPLVARAGRVAISGVPVEYADTVRKLSVNQRTESVPSSSLPFAVRPSAGSGIPVPRFALQVRELEIDSIRSVGSHQLFIAHTVHEEFCADAPEFFMIHGVYEAWQRRVPHRSGYTPPELRP